MTVIGRRRIEIVAFEHARVRLHGVPPPCPICQRAGAWLTAAQAAQCALVNQQTVYRWLAQGKAHGLKTAGGQHRVCLHSLFVQSNQ